MSIKEDDRKAFQKRFNISNETFEKACISWSEMNEIRADHLSHHNDHERAAAEVTAHLQKFPGVHSLKYRVKDPDHLLDKIVRKRAENPSRKIRLENYRKEITDLAGVRALHLYKADWCSIHELIMKRWHLYERKPTANVRKGDSGLELYRHLNCRVVEREAGYRSVHYLLKAGSGKEKQPVELQVRTIFEEGWSEIDHRIRYPNRETHDQVKVLLMILNRLAGAADELGSHAMAVDSAISELLRKESENKKLVNHLQTQLMSSKASDAQKTMIGEGINRLGDYLLAGMPSVSALVTAATIASSRGHCKKCGSPILGIAALTESDVCSTCAFF